MIFLRLGDFYLLAWRVAKSGVFGRSPSGIPLHAEMARESYRNAVIAVKNVSILPKINFALLCLCDSLAKYERDVVGNIAASLGILKRCFENISEDDRLPQPDNSEGILMRKCAILPGICVGNTSAWEVTISSLGSQVNTLFPKGWGRENQ